jgi:hypothetical protein
LSRMGNYNRDIGWATRPPAHPPFGCINSFTGIWVYVLTNQFS